MSGACWSVVATPGSNELRICLRYYLGICAYTPTFARISSPIPWSFSLLTPEVSSYEVSTRDAAIAAKFLSNAFSLIPDLKSALSKYLRTLLSST